MNPAAPRVYIVTESESRYTLLGAFGRQFGLAMANRGVRVNPDPGGPVSWTGDGRAAYIFFNHLASVEETYGWAGNLDRAGERSIVQWCVDHPLTLESAWLDRMSRDPGFRLLTVTSDDTHLLSLRFPNLKHATVWHGVDESALCNAAALESSHRNNTRDIDVIIAGSVASKPELDQYKSRVPQVLHKVCEDIIALRLTHPTMSFGQAMDVALPSGIRASDHWMMTATLFAYTTAAVGRARRVAAAQAMQGLNTVLVGADAWKEFATGTLKYAGQVAYNELPKWLHRSKVCLALSPPQFATGFSERLLLSMAAGCATVAEERLAITREFANGSGGGGGASPVQQYAPDRPELARILVGKLLTSADQRIAMGTAGRTIVEQNHLWVHRVGPVFAATGMLDQSPAQRAAA